MTEFVKGVTPSSETLDGSALRILIVHTRWNLPIVEGLVKGAKETLIKHQVRPENIVIESVPGAYELPFAANRLIQMSQVQAAQNSDDLFTSGPNDLLGLDLNADGSNKPAVPSPKPAKSSGIAKRTAFDAVICVGVLIKGSTMHFEYICEAVSQGIMRVGLDTSVPVIFGVLTCLNDDQALERAGMGKGPDKGHNHGEDWASAAVEMGLLKHRTL